MSMVFMDGVHFSGVLPRKGACERTLYGISKYIYILYIQPPNLGLEIAVFNRKREQGCFRETAGEHRGSTEALQRHES